LKSRICTLASPKTDTEIIRGLNLTVKAGEVAAIMGPNGSGKSTLSYILSGREDYEVTEGDILYNGESILELDPAERAAKGIFLAFQYPVEIPGVATMQFLKVAMNEQRKARGEAELTTPDFMRRVKDAAAELKIDMPDAEASAQRRLLRRREEARRNPADVAARAEALRSRRNRFRPRHRRAEDRRRRRQRAAFARPRRDRHHALPASARLHRAGHAFTFSTRARSSSRATRRWRMELEANGYADIIGAAA
jgi:adenylate kinase family enzyme